VETFGVCEVDSLLLANTKGRVLWSDDALVAVSLREGISSQRIWTQGMYRFATESGMVTQDHYARMSAKLVGFGYTFTSVTPEVFRIAGETATWDAANWPLKQALDYLSSRAVLMEDAAKLGAAVIAAACRALDRRELKRPILVEVAERLARRVEGPRAVKLLESVLPHVFGPVDVFGRAEAAAMFVAWRTEYARRVIVVGSR
jgi:hypothetical protein